MFSGHKQKLNSRKVTQQSKNQIFQLIGDRESVSDASEIYLKTDIVFISNVASNDNDLRNHICRSVRHHNSQQALETSSEKPSQGVMDLLITALVFRFSSSTFSWVTLYSSYSINGGNKPVSTHSIQKHPSVFTIYYAINMTALYSFVYMHMHQEDRKYFFSVLLKVVTSLTTCGLLL